MSNCKELLFFIFTKKNKKFTFTDKELKNVTEFNIDHLIISKENSMKVHEILHKLKNPYKEVFSLRVFSELSFKQIGSLFGKLIIGHVSLITGLERNSRRNGGLFMKITCDVIEDLLPLYEEGLVSDDTRILVEEHLNTCIECKKTIGSHSKP